MKICVTTTIYTHTGGLIRLYIVIWSVLSQFKWLLLFLHHAWRGHGARLSIRTKDPNNHSDTETGTLSKITLHSVTSNEFCETEFIKFWIFCAPYTGYILLCVNVTPKVHRRRLIQTRNLRRSRMDKREEEGRSKVGGKDKEGMGK